MKTILPLNGILGKSMILKRSGGLRHFMDRRASSGEDSSSPLMAQ